MQKCFIIVVVIFLPFDILSIEAKNFTFPSFYSPFLSEIHKIEFQGNYSLPSTTLSGVITTRTTQKSIPHRVLYFYYDNVSKNRATPKILTSVLKSIVLSLVNEVSFYKEILAEQDKRNLELYYYQNGFHEVKVDYVFFADTIQKKNILRFIITENQRYTINFISYSGLEHLSFELREKVENLRLLKTGMYFNELLLANELRSIRAFLRENGYFYAEYTTPKVVIDTTNKVDSIFVNFKLGNIVRINQINFLDSTFGQKRVGYNVKLNHLDIKPGDIFSQSKILSSEINLNSLGTFELVRIDTSSLFAPNTDTTLNLVVLLRYRKMRDFSVGLFTNRNLVEKTVNIGAEFSISDKNIFGGGQSANLYLRGFAIDINKVIFEKKSLEYEFQSGINFVQPLLWLIGNTRIALAWSILYSQRKVFSSLQLKTFSLPIKFTTRLPFWTYFNYLDLDLFFERQVPKNFSTASKRFYENARTFLDSLRIQQALSIYGNLDRYINTFKPILTSSIIGINLTGDNRDNPLFPTKGRLTNLGVEGFLFFGNAKYYRFNFNFLTFFNLSNYSVFAFKHRIGHILWFDKSISFVPYERHFFAGGANSVRGWASRQLRYYKGERIDTSSSTLVNSFLRDFVGNASLMETSLELRFRFGRPAYIGKTLGDILELFTATIFLDAGNAYQWLIKNEQGDFVTKYNLRDYVTGIATSLGFGIGFITPAGPLFLDLGFPIYDPNGEKPPMKNPVFHIRLGYSF